MKQTQNLQNETPSVLDMLLFRSLSFSEKSAWVMAPALCIGALVYYGPVLAAFLNGSKQPPLFWSVSSFVLVIIAFAIVGHIVVALSDVDAANASEDERDQHVRFHVQRWSGTVLGLLSLLALMVYMLIRSGDLLFHMIFAGFILSHLAEAALTIFRYRGSR